MFAGSKGQLLRQPGLLGDRWQRYFSLRDLGNVALFGLTYLAGYGYASFFTQNASAPLWLPDSILLCALLLTPKEKWWLYLLVAVPLRFIPGLRPSAPDWFIWSTLVNDTMKALFAALLLRRVAGSTRFNTVRKYLAYLSIAVILAPVFSALFGAAARWRLGHSFLPAFAQWFLGDALASLVITPALLLWFMGEDRVLRERSVEAMLWAAGFGLCLGYTVLLTRFDQSALPLYAPVLFLIWAAARLGTLGASTGIAITALTLMLAVSRDTAHMNPAQAMHEVHFVQLFLSMISLPVMFVAILFEERRSVEARLLESQQELKSNYQRIRDLAGRLIRSQEEERKRIARELHDDVGQQMALLSAGLDRLGASLPAAMGPEHTQLSELKDNTESVAAIVRELSHQLHSGTLRHLGIARGLEGLCRTFSQQHHVDVKFATDPLPELSDHVSLCLFRVAQEALNNAVKHGQAKQIEIRLARNAKLLRLEISDTGIGFNPADAAEGLGLVSMRERLRMVGGTLNLKSARGQGTVIEAVVDNAA